MLCIARRSIFVCHMLEVMTEKMSILTDDAIYEIYSIVDLYITLRLSSVSKSYRHVLISNLSNIADKFLINGVRILPDLFGVPKTPKELNRAILSDNYHVFSLILKYIEPHLRNVETAASCKNEQFLHDLLAKAKFDPSDLLQIASERDNMHLCKISIRQVPNKNRHLLAASFHESNNVMKHIFRSYKVNERVGKEALFNCVSSNNIQGVKFLIFQGIDPTTDCLKEAVRRNNDEMVNFLLDNGCKGANAAAELAAICDYADILTILVNHGITNQYKIREIGYATCNPRIIQVLDR